MSSLLRTSVAALTLAVISSSCVFAVGTGSDDGPADKAGKPHTAQAAQAAHPTGAAGKDAAADAAGAEAQAKKAEAEAKAAARKAEKKEREIAYARMELAIAEMGAQADLVDAEQGLEHARQELETARTELQHFQKVEMQLDQEDQKLDLDRSAENVVQQKQELEELMAMYKADEYAKMTKELVVRRGKFQLEMAERSSALEQKRAADHQSHTWPMKARELSLSVTKAEQAVGAAEAKLAKTKSQNELDLLRARHRLADAERPDDEADAGGESKGA